jgi:hypothetical protein
MGSSSSGGDFKEPPRGPAPPASSIAPQGQSTPFTPHFINFLGDTNTPSRGLSPAMLAAIDATNGPAQPPVSAPSGFDQQLSDLRNQLAAMQARKPQRQQQSPWARERGGGHSG